MTHWSPEQITVLIPITEPDLSRVGCEIKWRLASHGGLWRRRGQRYWYGVLVSVRVFMQRTPMANRLIDQIVAGEALLFEAKKGPWRLILFRTPEACRQLREELRLLETS